MSPETKKEFIPTKKEVIKNRVFGMPTTKLTRHQRVAFTAMVKIAYDTLMSDPKKITFEYDVKDFFEMIGITKERKQSHLFTKMFIDEEGWEQASSEYSLEKTLKNLVNKSIDMRYKNEDGKTYKIETTALLSHVKLTREKIVFRFDEWVREKIYVIDNSYVMQLPIIASLKSGYSVTLFEQLEQRRDFNVWQISTKALRQIFGLEDNKYKLFSDFRKFVIEAAKKELETKTNYIIKIEYKKEGRKIIKIIFTWYIETAKDKFTEWKQYMRENFINIDLLDWGVGSDPDKHLIAINKSGLIYNKRNPDFVYKSQDATRIWRFMYDNQYKLLIKKVTHDFAEESEDTQKYYGKDFFFGGDRYTNITLIEIVEDKYRVTFYSEVQMILTKDDLIKGILY
jgi:hypothetical protein